MNLTASTASLVRQMGPSSQIVKLEAEVKRVARSDYAVLILGETGTGKELVARAIQAGSPRVSKPFVAVDCGAIPESLIESELFGHERGAFTGADRQKAGRVEVARGGSLFLDEISNLPVSMQVKMLRLLQEKCFYRVGGTAPESADVRIICATNKDPATASSDSTFRRDLYYRIAEYVIHVPPLRERKQDIPYLAERFLLMACAELSKEPCRLTPSAVDALMERDWPGNVRELRNVVRRAALSAETEITSEHVVPPVPDEWSDTTGDWARAELRHAASEHQGGHTTSLREIVERSIAAVESMVLRQALEQSGGNKAEAARMLQVDYKTIHVKIKKYGISTRCLADPTGIAGQAVR